MSFKLPKSVKLNLESILISEGFDIRDFNFISVDVSTYRIEYLKVSDYVCVIRILKLSIFNIYITFGHPKDIFTQDLNSNDLTSYFKHWISKIKEELIELPSERKDDLTFSIIINSISPNFSLIYNEANKADLMRLSNISGMGFRKAFEYLIKDYVVYKGIATIENVKNIYKLQNVINLLGDDSITQQLATKIAHLGNDFSHYERKILDKEVPDLKEMIKILVDWIDTEENHKAKMLYLESQAKTKIDSFK